MMKTCDGYDIEFGEWQIVYADAGAGDPVGVVRYGHSYKNGTLLASVPGVITYREWNGNNPDKALIRSLAINHINSLNDAALQKQDLPPYKKGSKVTQAMKLRQREFDEWLETIPTEELYG